MIFDAYHPTESPRFSTGPSLHSKSVFVGFDQYNGIASAVPCLTYLEGGVVAQIKDFYGLTRVTFEERTIFPPITSPIRGKSSTGKIVNTPLHESVILPSFPTIPPLSLRQSAIAVQTAAARVAHPRTTNWQENPPLAVQNPAHMVNDW